MAKGIFYWLSWRGRVGRRHFIARLAAATAIFVLLFVPLEHLIGRGSTWLLYPPFFATVLSLAMRRLHDQGRSAVWLLATLIPVLGPLLLATLLLFRGGTAGPNPYGEDPRSHGLDYLQVNAIEHA